MLIPISIASPYLKEGKMQIKMKYSKQVLQSVMTQGINCVMESSVAVLIKLT